MKCFLPGLGGAKEARRALVAEFFAGSFDGDERHAEGGRDLALRSIAIGDELAGEEAKRSDVIHRMTEDGQMAVEVIDSSIALFEGEIRIDGGATLREDLPQGESVA